MQQDQRQGLRPAGLAPEAAHGLRESLCLVMTNCLVKKQWSVINSGDNYSVVLVQ